jgi:hypothetical protein
VTTLVYIDGLAGSIYAAGGANALAATGSTATLKSLGLNAQTNNNGCPTVGSPDVVRVTFYARDSASGTITQRETMYITAFTSGNGITSGATVLRAQEGTTQQAWAEGSTWASAWTAEDIDSIPFGVTAATTVTGPDTFGESPAVGTSSSYAREDHDHGLPYISTSGVAVTTKYPFTYDSSDLSTGLDIYVPNIGDFLLDCWVSITTAWDGTTPIGNLYVNTTGNTPIIYGYPVDMTLTDVANGAAIGAGLGLALTQYRQVWAMPGAYTFISTNPIQLVVSQDGTSTGGDPGSTMGVGAVYLVVLPAI